MIATLNPEATVGSLVAENPRRAKVFESLGIDYCCGGKRPLTEVLAEKGLELDAVLQALVSAMQQSTEQPDDWNTRSLTELADHIVTTHHLHLRRELPRIAGLLAKVVKAHSTSHPELNELAMIFKEFSAELFDHMGKEEEILFPAVRAIESGGDHWVLAMINRPIHCMEEEHARAGEALERMRHLTHGHTPPEGACNTYRALLVALADLEQDMHVHVHKENHILFPRALRASEIGEESVDLQDSQLSNRRNCRSGVHR